MGILAVAGGEGVADESTALTRQCQLPPVVVEGEWMRIIAAATDDIDITMGSAGWTTVGQVQMTDGLDGTLAVFLKQAAGETSDFIVNISGTTAKSIMVQCSQFLGGDGQDATRILTPEQAGTSHDPDSIDTVTAGAFVETVVFARGGGLTGPSVPSGYTRFGGYAGTNAILGSAYKEVASPSTEDPGIWTSYVVSANSCGITWALRPSVTGSNIDIPVPAAKPR
jgi:hypothetical protein